MGRISIVLAIVLLAHTAHAGERAGVTLPDALSVEGKPLLLNGMGIRKVTFLRIKAFVAGLYLETRSHSASEIIRSDQVKRLDMVMLRDVDREDIIDICQAGLGKNGADMVKLKASFDQFAAWMTDLKERDTMTFLYVPGRGLAVIVKGQVKGTIAGAEFSGALLSIWLGPKPVDDDLKDRLLGKG
jgi:Chalcone isomerase-like